MKKSSRNERSTNIPKICIGIFVLYAVFIMAFYFLAGDQLKLRESRGNLALAPAEAGSVELTQGTVIEQSFTIEIQRLEAISVQWGTYYRTNAGMITIELLDTRSGAVLMQGTFDAAAITEGALLTIRSEGPLEGLFSVPLVLRIYADSLPGGAATPLVNGGSRDGWQLFYNGEAVNGSLCFTASGEDYIWTGLHYWKFAAIGAALLALFLGIVCYKSKTGKHSYVANAFVAIQKYRFLIRQLVSRDFKTKYKRSVLGIFWSFLNPLLMMCVQYVVFSTIFKSAIENFAVYLLIGVVCFNFFSEACGMALSSIIGNASLITKVYMPKYIYPLTRVMSSVINLAISLIPLLLMCLFTGVHLQKSALLAFYFLICLIVFSLGLGLLLAASMVFFRDTQFLWSVFSMMWMYATPIFYPVSILPENLRWVLRINPLYHFLFSIRMCILNGISPEPAVYVQCMGIALVMLLVGAAVFYRSQDKFVLYL